jgi:WD40 repeat protein
VLILRGHINAVRCLAYSPDGRLLASGSDDATARLWDLGGGSEPTRLEPGGSVEAIGFTPDAKRLVIGTARGLLHLYDRARAEYPHTQEAHRNADGLRCLAHHPSRPLIATGGWDGAVRTWTADSLQRVGRFENGREAITALAFSPDGTTLAAAGFGGSIYLLDAHTCKPRTTLKDYASVLALAYSPDGNWLATAGGGGPISLWDRAGGQAPAALEGHTWTVYALAFTPDGRHLISGSADGTVRQWGVDGRLLHTFQWHTRWVTCLAVAPDGLTAAAGSEDCTIVIWDLPE